MVVSNCSSRVICCIAALLPHTLGLQPVNFIFNVLFIAMVKNYLFKHGRKINVLISTQDCGTLCWNCGCDVVGAQECEIKVLPYIGISTTYVGNMVPNFSPAR